MHNGALYFGDRDYIDRQVSPMGSQWLGRSSATNGSRPNPVPRPGTPIMLNSLEEISGFDVDRRDAVDLDEFPELKHMGRSVSTRVCESDFRWPEIPLRVASRGNSTPEALRVKRVPRPGGGGRPTSQAWFKPVAWMAENAGRVVNSRAESLRSVEPTPSGGRDG